MSPVIHEFDLKGQAFKRNPLPTFARMRDAGPVIPSRIPIFGPISFVTTYDAVSELLKSPDRFVVDARNTGNKRVMGVQWWMPRRIRLLADNMLTNDDPTHRRLRKLVDKAFHGRSVEAYRGRIAELADRLIDELAASAEKDLVARFARALPLTVICEVLGLPIRDRPKLVRWMASFSQVNSPVGLFRLLPAMGRLTKYLTAQFEERRREPRDDLITALVETEEEGDQLSEDELLALCFLLFVAGHETTTHLISGGVLALLQNQEQFELLKGDWSLAPSAVEELLRFVAPVQMTKPRFAIEDTEFAGQEIARGVPMTALLASANADPDAFEAPEQLDIQREKNRHMSFGGGPHFCLGWQLAKAEAEIALERLFFRYPGLALGLDESELRWTKRVGLRALTALPVKLAA